MLLVSIIIVNYKTPELTKKCIESVYKFEQKDAFEIVLVDNGSNDGSVDLFKSSFQDIQLIENTDNLGFAKANNQGIKASNGKYIFLLNSDTELVEPILEKLIKIFELNQYTGAVVPRLLNSDHTLQPSVFRLPTVTGAIKEYWFNQSNYFGKYAPNQNKSTVLVESAVMAAMLIPRQILDQVGLLDEKYFMYFEDLEFCRRLRKNGLKIIYSNDSQLLHHHGASNKKDDNAWKRLIPSSKQYHGLLNYYLITIIIRCRNTFKKVFS